MPDCKQQRTHFSSGAASYVLSATVSEGISIIFYPPQNVTERIMYSMMQETSVDTSNIDLLDFVLSNFNRREKDRILMK